MRSPGLSDESIRAMLEPYQGQEGGLRLLPGGHFLPAEAPHAFAAQVIEFAKSL
jgi:pimeloyl-ACP methyl ester carboxylesterase